MRVGQSGEVRRDQSRNRNPKTRRGGGAMEEVPMPTTCDRRALCDISHYAIRKPLCAYARRFTHDHSPSRGAPTFVAASFSKSSRCSGVGIGGGTILMTTY